jgi:hypothetical protein
MKKLLVLMISLILTGACSSRQTNRELVAPNTNKVAETKPASSVSLAEMEVREKATWEAMEKKNYDGVAETLASDYLEIGDDGTFDKTALVNALKDLKTTDATFADWKMLPLTKNTVIVLYTVTIKGTYKEQQIPPGPYRASSAWVNRDGKWLAIYYQQTAVKPAATPAAMEASPAKSVASPAVKVAEAGGDPIANEKLVWDAIKRKDSSAFEALLAPESIEVEADGVYDKAASVKSISQFDASTAELSDWKTIKLDSDASIVTYLMKLPGAPSERHSTIWINRNGKWSAIFHQGTPEAKRL